MLGHYLLEKDVIRCNVMHRWFCGTHRCCRLIEAFMNNLDIYTVCDVSSGSSHGVFVFTWLSSSYCSSINLCGQWEALCLPYHYEGKNACVVHESIHVKSNTTARGSKLQFRVFSSPSLNKCYGQWQVGNRWGLVNCGTLTSCYSTVTRVL